MQDSFPISPMGLFSYIQCDRDLIEVCDRMKEMSEVVFLVLWNEKNVGSSFPFLQVEKEW